MGAYNAEGKLLNRGPTEFDPSDKLYYFSKLFGKTDEDHYMFLPICNLHIFKDQGKKRIKTCYLVGKGFNRSKHPPDSIPLNRQLAQDQQALADLLNECHTFYCYDKLTAMMEIARLCGCKVQYYGDYSIEELKQYEPGLNGINSELDVLAFRKHYINMIKKFDLQIDKFIKTTQI
jgi:hypothetical protein